MAKLQTLVALLFLVFLSSAFRVDRDATESDEKLAVRAAYEEYFDEPEAFDNAFRLLNAIMLDGVSIRGGAVTWFFGKGKKEECVDNKKSLKPKCKWTGLVTSPGGDHPEKQSLLVFSKYCNKAGLSEPEPKIIEC